ncbi:MAG TPA: hypothetical protein VHT71_14435 [Methylomirabilota bacterium]|nr:hypothetical protein [Methylomirabilota bacterium]
MIAMPTHVESGTTSWKTNRPNSTLTSANAATYAPSRREKSHGTRFTTRP